jgi:anthranilate synthase component 2
MMHGKTSEISVICDDILFKNLPKQMTQTRYHSLIVNKQNLPNNITVTSKRLDDDDEIMSLKIKDKDIYGVQFHPESVMSEYGHEIINNFLKI